MSLCKLPVIKAYHYHSVDEMEKNITFKQSQVLTLTINEHYVLVYMIIWTLRNDGTSTWTTFETGQT